MLVSLGTLNQEAGGRFYDAILGAAERLSSEVQLVLVAPDALVGAVPSNVLLRERVPQLALLPHLDAVVCHGGHNTVCEALAHGLPLVSHRSATTSRSSPLEVAAGAGLRVRFGQVPPTNCAPR